MKDGFVKIATSSPRLWIANPRKNCDECISEARRASETGVKVLVFPELALTGSTAADLYFHAALLDSCERELERYVEETAGLDMLSVIGVPAAIGGKIYNVAAVVSRGILLALVAKSYLATGEARHFAVAPKDNREATYAGYRTIIGNKIIFECRDMPSLRVSVSVGSDASAPLSPMRYHAAAGATLVLSPTSYRECAGVGERAMRRLLSESETLICAIAEASSGEGESGTDGIYSGRCAVTEMGTTLAVKEAFSDETLLCTEIDTEALRLSRLRYPDFESDSCEYYHVPFLLNAEETVLTRKVERSPFIPENKGELSHRLDTILDIQSRALAHRIERSYSKGAVLGISGGLDSTLALLVAVRAMRHLGRDASSVTSVTMPGFGTTARTKSNAERLTEALGARLVCVDIKAAVTQHFKDIGHREDDYGVVYENAQARERTQVLMDIANAEGALVVGTGDLSELALGWATYNGDHMSMYGVNAGIPKTLMRHAIAHAADTYESEGATLVAEILRDVLDTPVSPELLPPKDGEIAQCTEGIVGPYELHDFFLYYLVRLGFAPSKILRLAKYAFDGEYSAEVIESWLRVFVKRFFAQQFKRSCLPDGPAADAVSFSPRGGFMMPSDADAGEWISDIDK